MQPSSPAHCCAGPLRALKRVCGFLVADFFEPADDFSTKMRKVLPLFGTVFFLANESSSMAVDAPNVLQQRIAHREWFFLLYFACTVFNSSAVFAYVYLRCTRRSPPPLISLVVFCWTLSNASASAITYGQNALCILTSVILSNIALAANIPGRWVVVVLNSVIAATSAINSQYDYSLFLAQKSDDWSPMYIILFVVFANAMISLYLTLFHSAYAESVEQTQLATETANQSASLAAAVAQALSKYDTDTVDSQLRGATDHQRRCDPQLVACLVAINENLKRYRAHLPNYVITASAADKAAPGTTYTAAATFDGREEPEVVQWAPGRPLAASGDASDVAAQTATTTSAIVLPSGQNDIHRGGNSWALGASDDDMTDDQSEVVVSLLTDGSLVSFCEMTVTLPPPPSDTVNNVAGALVTVDQSLYDKVVRVAHDLAAASGAAVHGFIADKMTFSWNATDRQSSTETAATALAWKLSHAASDLFSRVPGTRITAAVTTGRAIGFFAGSKRHQTFVLTAPVMLRRAQELTRLAQEWAGAEGGDCPIVVIDALTCGSAKVATRVRGAAVLPASLVEPGSASVLAAASSDDYEGYPRVVYRALSEPVGEDAPTSSRRSSRNDLCLYDDEGGFVVQEPNDHAATRVHLAIARGDMETAERDLQGIRDPLGADVPAADLAALRRVVLSS